MSESKTISLRIPENILTEIDRIAQEKYKSHKGTPNRSLVILDALEAYINTPSCDAITLIASHDGVLTERVQELEKTVSQILEDFKQFKELSIAVHGTAIEVSDLPDPIFIAEPDLLPHQSNLFAVSGDANNASKSTDDGLTIDRLAERIGSTNKVILKERGRHPEFPSKFLNWVRKKDPNGFGWEYKEESGLFHKVELPV
jgi:metal-responsive CopG/Arc/MetJ family transcriptional regulator